MCTTYHNTEGLYNVVTHGVSVSLVTLTINNHNFPKLLLDRYFLYLMWKFNV